MLRLLELYHTLSFTVLYSILNVAMQDDHILLMQFIIAKSAMADSVSIRILNILFESGLRTYIS